MQNSAKTTCKRQHTDSKRHHGRTAFAYDLMNHKDRKTLVIASDGSGDYNSLTEAVAACDTTRQEPVLFYIRNGVYNERPFIELEDYRIEGESEKGTVITASCGGRDPWPGESKTGTFRSATVFLGGGRAEVSGITIENTAGDGIKAGQALAVYADADHVLMEGVTLKGNQDTLFTAPLPLREREPGGFRGPRENAPRRNTEQYYLGCRIIGNIDFIFGGADAVFDHCRIEPLQHERAVSYITAPSTPKDRHGYLFTECTVEGNCPPGSVFLGRPWRADAACSWIDCTMDQEVHPQHWDNWNDPSNETTARFSEYGSRGEGAGKNGGFGTVDDPEEYQRELVFLQEMRQKFGI